MKGGGREAASFDPDPLFHSCLSGEEGIAPFFLGPKATDFNRSFQNRVGSVLEAFLGCKKRLLAPEQVAFWAYPGRLRGGAEIMSGIAPPPHTPSNSSELVTRVG